ncbi:hypothetical protein G6F65_021378 [Rhizopus arrhizus]|nr:hypothetical protein G6F65_021378 [Rhizopus arrhizus]
MPPAGGARRVLAHLLQLAAGERAAQRGQFRGGLGEVHVDGVQLLHRGHLRGGGGFDQRAFGDQRLADAARDGRGDVGIAQVDGRVVLRGLGGRHGGVGLAERRHGVVVFLLADGVGLDQRGVAVGQQLGAEQIRLRLLQLCPAGFP